MRATTALIPMMLLPALFACGKQSDDVEYAVKEGLKDPYSAKFYETHISQMRMGKSGNFGSIV